MATLSAPIANAGTTTPEYGDGDTPGWTWDGTAGASTSTRTAVGPAVPGATTLTVADAVDFSEAGGELAIGTEVHTYTSADDDTGVLTLATALVGSYGEGEPVELYPRSLEKFAQVMVGDLDETVQAYVPHALWDRIPDGIRDEGAGEIVALELDGTDYTVAGVVGAEPEVDGGYLNDDSTPPEALADGSLYATIGFVDGGFVAGDLLGANMQMSAAGLTAQNADAEQTFQVDALTGNVTSVGMFASSTAPDEAHVVIGDLAGTGTTRSFMYFYTGAELDSAGLPVTGYAPGEVSSGIDTDGTRYVRLRSPDTPSVNQGELTVRSSMDAATRPTLGWAGDIRLRGDAGIVYALNASEARAPLTIQGSALVLDVPNGTMRLGEAVTTGANRLRSRDSADTARRMLELEAQTIHFDVDQGGIEVRGHADWRCQLGSSASDVGVVLLYSSQGVRISDYAGSGYRAIAASAFNVNSDAEAKSALTTVDPQAALSALRTVKVYDYTRADEQRRQRGVLAQDMQQVLPIAAVQYEDQSLSVDLYALASTTMAATQALAARVESIEAKVAHLPTTPPAPTTPKDVR